MVGGTDVGVGGYGWGGNGDGLNWWEDTVAKIILGTEPNASLASDPILELHNPIMSMLGCNGVRLERDREKKLYL